MTISVANQVAKSMLRIRKLKSNTTDSGLRGDRIRMTICKSLKTWRDSTLAKPDLMMTRQHGHSKKNCPRKIHRFYSESQSTTSKTPSNMMVGTLKGKVLVQWLVHLHRSLQLRSESQEEMIQMLDSKCQRVQRGDQTLKWLRTARCSPRTIPPTSKLERMAYLWENKINLKSK